MVYRIEVKSKVLDTRVVIRSKIFKDFRFGSKIKNLHIVDVYTIEKNLTPKQLRTIGEMLTLPLTQGITISSEKEKNPNFPKDFDWAIEIGFLPGVTDNVATTVKEEIEDFTNQKFKEGEGVYTSQITFLEGNLNQGEVEEIAESLINPLIQRVHIKDISKFKKDKGMDFYVPRVKLTQKLKVDEVDLNISDEELALFGKQGIKNPDGTRRGPLALSLLYLKTIQRNFKKLKRNPTDIELETLAQTWSEHCKHTIFADPLDEIKQGLFKTYIKGATEEIIKKRKDNFCVSVFKDNSGAVEFDGDYLITHKVETHNSPSALDPYGGAITGIVGVNRDTLGFGLGAKPILNTYFYCFADPSDQTKYFRDSDLTQEVLSARKILDGVIEGVRDGGNCSGIPTPQGGIYFDNRFRAKPLVFCGTVGLIPKKIGSKKSFEKKAKPGDCVVMIGGRVGLDGIHGATFSSEAISAGSPATAVQIGDPITQKKFSDALVKEARDLNLYNSITDNGAGGLSSSVGEMSKESGGVVVNLEKVPLKYPGLAPWQIWISESQERMTLAVQKKNWKAFQEVMKRHGVEATIIGEFNKSGKCVVKFKGKTVLDLSLEFLHNGLPKKQQISKKPLSDVIASERSEAWQSRLNQDSGHTSFARMTGNRENYTRVLEKMLSRLNITSFEFISTQYDHEVQGESVLKPLQGKGRVNCDTTVSRPLLNSKKGVVLSQGAYPSYSDIDTYHMAAASIDTAVRNCVAAGANLKTLVLLDNFCWYSGDDPESLYKLKQAAKACYDYSIAYGTPLISGKDSMFNDFKGYDEKGNFVKISVPPTLLISGIGVVDDILKVVSLDLKSPGDLIYLLGDTFDELGGSEYCGMLAQSDSRRVPQVNAKKNLKIYQSLQKAIEQDLVASSISVGRGGLGVALAKTAIGGMLGIDINLKDLKGDIKSDEAALFSESQGRIIVSINPSKKDDFELVFKGNAFGLIGKVTEGEKVLIKGVKGKTIVETDVRALEKAYKNTFRDY